MSRASKPRKAVDPFEEDGSRPAGGLGAQLLRAWRRTDYWLIKLTKNLLFLVGLTFTTFLFLGIVGRYVADFALSFVEAGARFLLVWFFLLGAGLALREKAHVGFELLRQSLPRRMAQGVALAAHACVLVFGLLVLLGSGEALSISASHVEPTVGLSQFWAMLSVPVGVALMLYHQVCIIAQEHLGVALRGNP